MNEMHDPKENRDRYSLRGRVYESIREDILNGRYPQHTELKETAIGTELGVSRTPVREALRQLELEGLVTIIPNRGAYVNAITAKDVKDIYSIRSMLEGLCARWATEEITKEQLDGMEEIICLTEYHTEKGNYGKLHELDSQFHERLYEASENRSVKSTQEHRAIFEAIRDRKPDLAEELASQHIRRTIESIQLYGLDNIL